MAEENDGAPIDLGTARDLELRGWLNRRFVALDAAYLPYQALHRDLASLVLPDRAEFLPADAAQDTIYNPDILNDTATYCADVSSAGMMSGMTGPWRPWFLLSIADRKRAALPAVKTWLHGTTERLHWLLLMTNLYTELPPFYMDEVNFGTAAMMAFEDDERLLRFETLPVGSYRLAEGKKGIVQTNFEAMWLSVEQLVDEFGIENVSEAVATAYEGGERDRGLEVRHAIFRNPREDKRRDEAMHKPWADIYWEASAHDGPGPVFLRYDGFDEFPLLAGRWFKRAGRVYGTGPGIRQLGNIRSIQAVAADRIDALHRYVVPNWRGPTSLRNQPINTTPNGVTLYDETKGTGKFEPAYQQTVQLGDVGDYEEELAQRIRRGYFVDLFNLMIELDKSDVTAEEIIARRDERLSQLAPTFERNTTDVNTPLVERTFYRAEARGLLEPLPQELRGVPLQVRHTSIMAVQLAALASRGMATFGGEILQLAQGLVAATGNPTAGSKLLQKVNWDRFVDRLAEMRGVPPEIIVSDMELAQARRAEQKAQQQQQMLQAAESMGRTAKDLAAAKMDGDNALSRLTPSPGAPPGPAAQPAPAGAG